MKATFRVSRASGELKARTYCERPERKVESASGGALEGFGWAAISQDGQGVGTLPI